MIMLIYACTVILTIICEVIATDPKDYAPNVGTVLFSKSDLNKKKWSKSEIALLKARRYFQVLLPPPVFINNFNEDYVNVLLGYFKDAYSAIRRESPDPETDTIMTTALSDAIGGYLKVWVLPVAKLDYYGGTISQNSVVKLYHFYNEIKGYLDSDGTGWRDPDENFLNSMTINVAPLKLISSTRSMKDPCANLAYFEKTDTGLGIPIPNVNWNAKSMFIPLKNTSLIRMNTPDSSQNLIKYYDAARSCIQFSNPKEQEKFDQRFQDWLVHDVVPHLKDENLYLALGSVLTLVNRTRDLCNNVIDLYGNRLNMCKRPQSHALVDLSCKKMWIIIIILLIEVAWCIPALMYILCSKRMHKKDCTSNVYLFIDNNKMDKKGFFKGRSPCVIQDTIPQGTISNIKPEIKFFRRSNLNDMEFQSQVPTSNTKIPKKVGTASDVYCVPSYPVANKASDATSNQSKTIAKKSSLKKPTVNIFPDQHNSMQLMALSSHNQTFSVKPSQSTSVTTVRNVSKSLPVDCTSPDHKNRKKQIKVDNSRSDDRRKSEECCMIPSEVRSNRASDEQKRVEELRKAEELKKQEEHRKAEEFKRQEERKRADNTKKQEERRKAEEFKKLEEQRRAEEFNKLEERRRAEEFKKLEERRRAEEFKKSEERRKADECKKNEEHRISEERRKAEECRKAEELKNLEERKKAKEIKKLDERKKAEKLRKLEERKKSEELRKLQERKESEQLKRLEERNQKEECEKLDERRMTEERGMAEERRNVEELKKVEECKQLVEYTKLEDRRNADEVRILEDRRRAEECKLQQQDNYKTQEESRVLQKLEECRSLAERIKAEEHSRRFELLDDQHRILEEQNDESKKIKECRSQKKSDRFREIHERKKPDEAKTCDEYNTFEGVRQFEECRQRDETIKYAESRELEGSMKYDEARRYDDATKYEEIKQYDEARNLDEFRRYEEIRQIEAIKKYEESKEYDDRIEPESKNLQEYENFNNYQQIDAHRAINYVEGLNIDGSKNYNSLTNILSDTRIYNDFTKIEDRREPNDNYYNRFDNRGGRADAYSAKTDDLGAPEGSCSNDTSDQGTREVGFCNNLSDRLGRDDICCTKRDDRLKQGGGCFNNNQTNEVEVREDSYCHKIDEPAACCCKRNDNQNAREHSSIKRSQNRKEWDDSSRGYRRHREDRSYFRNKDKKDSCLKNANKNVVKDVVKYDTVDRKSSGFTDYNSGLGESRDSVHKSSCPCTDCVECADSRSTSTCRATSDSLPKYPPEKPKTKTTRFQITKERVPERRGKRKNSVKLTAGKSPYLEITIDRPTTEICVDMGQCKTHYSSYKPSKIPKRAANNQPCHKQGSEPAEKQRSLIPQRKKKTLDDIALGQCDCSRSCESRLNDTF